MADKNGLYLFPGETAPRRMKFRERVGAENVTDCLMYSDAEWAAQGVTRHDRPSFNPDTHRVSWDTGSTSWSTIALSASEVAVLLDVEKTRAKARATTEMQAELAIGITIAGAGGMLVRTDDIGQSQLRRLKDRLATGGSQRLVTRAGSKVTADQATANLLHDTVETYVSEMVDAEFAAHDAIDALTALAAVRSYRHSWPSRAR